MHSVHIVGWVFPVDSSRLQHQGGIVAEREASYVYDLSPRNPYFQDMDPFSCPLFSSIL